LNPADSVPAGAPLAVIGISCLFPRAAGLGAYWAVIKNRIDTITEVPPTHWRPEDYYHPDPKAPDRIYTARGGFLEPVAFNPAAFGIAPNSLEATDTAQLLGLVVAQQALADAGYGVPSWSVERGAWSEKADTPLHAPRSTLHAPRVLDRSRVSVILGVTGTLELVIPLGARLGHPVWRRALAEAGVAPDVADDVVRRIADSYVPWQENSFPGLLGNVVAGRIANRLDLGGTNCVVDAACASSFGALHLAALELTSGRSDLVLTGGVDTFNDIFMYMCFSKTPALSPTGDARPFDAAGDGTILGEGLGMVVLKRLADARRDGDRIYAVLRGVGSSSDGKGNAVYAPKASGQVECLRAAYRAAGVSPETVELVEAHGTGTRVGDATEVAALTEVYEAGERRGTWCALGSVKSQIGHTKAAAR
jgi:acyl transferase domain-containing protein